MNLLCTITALLLITSSYGQDAHKFSVDLYKEIARSSQNGQNIAISPFSADAALSMTYVGAAGNTKKELGSALGVGQGVLNSQLAQKFKTVNAASQGYTLQSANGIFLEQTYEILPQFRRTVTSDFGANISSVDFLHQAEAARLQINAFAAAKTNNKIKDLIEPNILDQTTKLVLVNAVYFKADWEEKFKEYQTWPEQFHLTDGTEKSTNFMNQEATFGLATSTELVGAQVLELKFKNAETSMLVILPKKETGLQGLESSLTAASLDAALDQIAPQRVNVYLPKFKVEASYQLEAPLQTMGVKTAFTNAADFSGISNAPLKISKVVQKVFVKVNEEGAEAAAATAVVMVPASAGPDPNGPSVFRADRPFLYLIRHNQSKAILFIGRVSDPTVEN